MRFIIGVLVGVFLACLSGAASLPFTPIPFPPSNILWTGSADLALTPLATSVAFTDRFSGELLRIDGDGKIFYKGRFLGTDSEVLWGLRSALAPGEWCQRWEESLPWGRP